MSAANDAARAEASALLKKLREQGVLPAGSASEMSPLPKTPSTEESVSCIMQGTILRAQLADSDDDVDEEEDYSEPISPSGDQEKEVFTVDEPDRGDNDFDGSSDPHRDDFDEQVEASQVADQSLRQLELTDPSERLVHADSPGASGSDERFPADPKRCEFLWTRIEAAAMDETSQEVISKTLIAHNEGAEFTEADHILQPLQGFKGAVLALIKVEIPQGMRRGTRIHFRWQDMTARTVYKGASNPPQHKAVFAVIEKPERGSFSKKLFAKMGGSWRRSGSNTSSGSQDAPRSPISVPDDAASETAIDVGMPELLSEYVPRDPRRLEVVWCDADCAEVEDAGKEQVSAALESKMQGKEEFMPTFLYEALKGCRGQVLALVKIRIPEGTERGQALAFKFDVAQMRAVYTGPKPPEAYDAVFALHEKLPTPLSKKLASGLSSGLKRFTSSPKDPEPGRFLGAAGEATQVQPASELAEPVAGKKIEFVWTAVSCEQLESLSDPVISRALRDLNKGRLELVPGFLAEAMAHLKGSILGIVKVEVPDQLKAGQKLQFEYEGQSVVAVYGGAPTALHQAVFVVREKRGLASRLGSSFKAGLTKFDALRGLPPDGGIEEPEGVESASAERSTLEGSGSQAHSGNLSAR